MKRSIARLAVTAATAGSILVATVTPAHAAGEILCGSSVFNYGKVALASCFWEYDDGMLLPMAKMRTVETMNPDLWSSCTLLIYTFVKYSGASSYVQIRTSQQACLLDVKWMSAHPNQTVPFWDDDNAPFYNVYGNCYKVVSRWYGKYNGSDIGSNPNAESQPYC